LSDTAISFDRVCKRYRRRRGKLAATFRSEITRTLRGLTRNDWDSPSDFWALRDVSFGIRAGETVGLIGANGAGKSTTLKILSRVTTPTSGHFSAQGRIGALIEVGAGFHPELSGHDNIYLNGAILGMRRAEVDAKLDKIIAFAELQDFLEMPLKRYSSGMEVRLGFSVAAHVEPDILLVDEVLAVGDVAFQAKCLNKLAELKEQAKTVVLVSHNMASIVQHCDRVLWMDHGRLRAWGEPEAIVESYLATVRHSESVGTAVRLAHDVPLRLLGLVVKGNGRPAGDVLEYGHPAIFEVRYEWIGPKEDVVIQVNFHDGRGQALGGLTSRFGGFPLDGAEGLGTARLVLSPVIFTRGAYSVSVAVLDERLQRHLAYWPGAATFTVDGPSVASREVSGHVVYPHFWEKGD